MDKLVINISKIIVDNVQERLFFQMLSENYIKWYAHPDNLNYIILHDKFDFMSISEEYSSITILYTQTFENNEFVK